MKISKDRSIKKDYQTSLSTKIGLHHFASSNSQIYSDKLPNILILNMKHDSLNK